MRIATPTGNSFVEWVKAQDGKATIANVSKEGSMERVTMKFITDATGMKIQQISFDKGAPRYGALAGVWPGGCAVRAARRRPFVPRRG